MAILAMVKLGGDPELLAAKREFMDPVAERVFPEATTVRRSWSLNDFAASGVCGICSIPAEVRK